jgi:KDO2-lipid IV(A) lauroyltransferase
MAQQMATAFEQGIMEHLEDWHMLQKLFVADLDPERLAKSRARNGNGNGASPVTPSPASPPATPSPTPPPATSDNSKKSAEP